MMVALNGLRVAVLPSRPGRRERGGRRRVGQQVLRVLQQRTQLSVQHVEPAECQSVTFHVKLWEIRAEAEKGLSELG